MYQIKKTIDYINYDALKNNELYLKSSEEIEEIFQSHPETIKNANDVSNQCHFSLDELKYNYPSEVLGNEVPIVRLRHIMEKGLEEHIGGIPKSQAIRRGAKLDKDLL